MRAVVLHLGLVLLAGRPAASGRRLATSSLTYGVRGTNLDVRLQGRAAVPCVRHLIPLAVALAACVPAGGTWEHGPVDVSPTPVVLHPPHLLNTGKVRAELCLGLADRLAPPTIGSSAARIIEVPDIRLADGRVVRLAAEVRTPSGELWPHDEGFLIRRDEHGAAAYCFGAKPGSAPVPRYATVTLSATAPLRLLFVRWNAAAFGSL